MFGDVLKDLRKKKGVTQIQLAKNLEISNGTIGNWEINARQPDHDMLVKIADYFGVTVDYLLGREADSERDEKPQLHIPDKYKDVLVAFEGGPDDLTQDDIDDVVKYIEFVRARKKKD
jgi:transcriptional regulator with XRE-family HTH domain